MKWQRPQTIGQWLVTSGRLARVLGCGLITLTAQAAPEFTEGIQPILEKYCFDCHADGTKKGGVVFDEFPSEAAMLDRHELWLGVLKNVRAGLMPPPKKARPSAGEQERLEKWIKAAALKNDPANPDPGRVTLRRLNRVEYRNTIRDLMGVEFHSEIEFPPDDTGYGFDNIGDVLTVSPMLLEKYMAAAKTIVAQAVPLTSRIIPETTIPGNQFRDVVSGTNRKATAPAFSYYEAGTGSYAFRAESAGSYRVTLELSANGQFDFDPGRCRVVFRIDGRELLQKEFGWYDGKLFRFDFDEKWEAGEHRMSMEVEPLVPVEKKLNSLEMRLLSVKVNGPLDEAHWIRPRNYERFFTRQAPEDPAERRVEAGTVLRRFATKAFRRPVDEETVGRLTAIAEAYYKQPGKTFEAGVAHAMQAVLASPRFLLRLEEAETSPGPYAPVDEYSLASRLSYFLWSTMPDDELTGLAARGELRANLPAQVQRLLADSRASALIQNFPGQWLQTRDVEGTEINARAVQARDNGTQRDFTAIRRRIEELNAIPEEERTLEQKTELQEIFARRRQQFNKKPPGELDGDLKRALREETEMYFAYLLHGNRSVLELIESDYTFLNERLAAHYGLSELKITGAEMRRVTLPDMSARGGILTHGSVLVVTSNPDRTSPVKRGLFILDNILGTPAPPPPADIPALEASEQHFKDHEPTLRETLALHREKPLCASCHDRMDPLGLAFENFNALGMWRESERKQPIETAGKLVTGESFNSVRELKHILVTGHRIDFYRCLTEKMLTYALGRGVEYYDVETIDKIVSQLDQENGRILALLTGIIESVPFQKMRIQASDLAINPEPEAAFKKSPATE